jgi:PilZ domain-containing protein
LPHGEGSVNSLNEREASERRGSPRRAADWRVLFGPVGDLALGFMADMSPLGVSVVTEKQSPIGTELEVHFGLEEDNLSGRLQMRGVVRHCRVARIGVQFVDVQPAQREHWWKIMKGEV